MPREIVDGLIDFSIAWKKEERKQKIAQRLQKNGETIVLEREGFVESNNPKRDWDEKEKESRVFQGNSHGNYA